MPQARMTQDYDPIRQFYDECERMAHLLRERCDRLEDGAEITRLNALETKSDADANLLFVPKGISETLNPWPVLCQLLEDDSISDILINGTRSIYVERGGKLEETPHALPSDEETLAVARAIVRGMGRELDARRPYVDTRLADGSRVNIITPPLAVDGTMISIRKFSRRNISIDDMVASGSLSKPLGEFLKICGKSRLSILISGGTGSGKTTLLNALSQFIETNERIVTIEDAAELRLQQPHVVRLETRIAGAGVSRDEEVTTRDMVRNALRMRPDRIVVGEVRGAEAFDMMQAMNTGHEGSLTTIHANHPRDALSRLENMVSMANVNIPNRALRYQISSAIHLIVQVSRMRDGQRRVTHVSEVVGMEGDIITMHDLFNFMVEGEDNKGNIRGRFIWNNIMPRFLRRIGYYGELDHLSEALNIKLPKL